MIKKLISKLFGIKQCACPEDEHIEYYTKVPEPEIPVHEEPKWKCGPHITDIKKVVLFVES